MTNSPTGPSTSSHASHSPESHADTGNPTGPGPALRVLAGGRLLLAAAALAAPRRFAAVVGVASSPELTYMTRIYGARALAMGLGYLTASTPERLRWQRLGLMVDIADTGTGLVHLARRDVPARAAIAMVALTGSYAVAAAADVMARRGQVARSDLRPRKHAA
ncbi:hypothetical protein [Nocardia sp. NPDC057668]|uniref:hypothetical protein n=1 Tax=Nocardia sp. NPDC057668 TaxID=3346202 RepID=UPI0036719759